MPACFPLFVTILNRLGVGEWESQLLSGSSELIVSELTRSVGAFVKRLSCAISTRTFDVLIRHFSQEEHNGTGWLADHQIHLIIIIIDSSEVGAEPHVSTCKHVAAWG